MISSNTIQWLVLGIIFMYFIWPNELKENCENDVKNCPNCFDFNPEYARHCIAFFSNIRRSTHRINLVGNTRSIQYKSFKDPGTNKSIEVVLKNRRKSFLELRQKICNKLNYETRAECDDLWSSKGRSAELIELLQESYEQRERVITEMCTPETIKRLMKPYSNVFHWTLLNLDMETIMMKMFNNGNIDFPVPKLLPSFGFTTVEANAGESLTKFYNSPISLRLYLAHEMLEGALKFTEGVNGFGFYLTDITPDNIVVDRKSSLLKFIDFDHVIVLDQLSSGLYPAIHRNEYQKCGKFEFIERDLCSYKTSDFNIYSVCKVLYDDPECPSGLLHGVREFSPEIESLLEECVKCQQNPDRFSIAKDLLRWMHEATIATTTSRPIFNFFVYYILFAVISVLFISCNINYRNVMKTLKAFLLCDCMRIIYVILLVLFIVLRKGETHDM